MDPNPTEWLVQLGLGGAVLAWLMWQVMPRLKSVEMSIDRMSRAILLHLVAQGPSAPVAEQARGILREIDDAEKQRRRGV